MNFYARHVESIVERFKGKVKYYITYNEINLAAHMPDLVAGARLPEGMSKQEMYIQLNVNVQVAHARAVEVIKRVDPQAQVGGMIGHAPFYPLTCKAEDVMAADFKNKCIIILFMTQCVMVNFLHILCNMLKIEILN